MNNINANTKEYDITINELASMISDGFTRVESDIYTLNIKVDALQEDVSILKSDVSILKTEVSILKTDVSTLKQDVTNLNMKVTGLDQSISILNKKFDSMESHVLNNMVVKYDFDTLKIRTGALEALMA